MKSIIRLAFFFACMAMCLTSAEAQLSLTKIVQEGDAVSYVVPGGGGLVAIDSVGVLRFSGDSNSSGDLAFQFDTADGNAHIGLYEGAPFTVARTQQGGLTRGGDTFAQSGFDGEIGLADDDSLIYGATVDQAGGATGLKSVWKNDTLVILEGDAAANGSTNFLDVHTTASGSPSFMGGGPDSGHYTGVAPVNDVAIGASVTVAGGGSFLIDGFSEFDHDADDTAGNIVRADIDTGSSADDGIVLINGAAVASGAGNLREGDLASDGLDNWDNFDLLDINSAGSYLVTGDTDGDSNSDEFVSIDGQILVRELDTVGGITIDGGIENADLNENGDWAVIWDDDQGNELLLIGNDQNIDRVLLTEGDSILLDGTAATWSDFDIGLRITDRLPDGTFNVYLLGNVDGGGTSEDLWVTFNVTPVPEPATLAILCVAACGLLGRRRQS